MAKYIAKRVALALVTLVIVSMLTFFLMFLVPGGPFLSEKSPSPAVLAAMEEKYGLDKPVIVQYKNYMLNLLQGELGPSIKQRGRTVAQIIGSRFPVSARIGGIALAIAVVVGVVLGSVAALNRGKWIDNVIIVIATCGIAVPELCCMYHIIVYIQPEAGVAAVLRPYGLEKLYYAGHRSGLLPHGVHLPPDALFHAGCAGAGLHAHRPRQGSFPGQEPV